MLADNNADAVRLAAAIAGSMARTSRMESA
jgi:hypothetical protein